MDLTFSKNDKNTHMTVPLVGKNYTGKAIVTHIAYLSMKQEVKSKRMGLLCVCIYTCICMYINKYKNKDCCIKTLL